MNTVPCKVKKTETSRLQLGARTQRLGPLSPKVPLMTAALVAILVACNRGPVEENDRRDFRPVLAHMRNRQATTYITRQIEQAINDFHLYLGRYPSNLVEIVKAGYLDQIPDPPPGMGYLYDPATGIFRIAPRPSQQGAPP